VRGLVYHNPSPVPGTLRRWHRYTNARSCCTALPARAHARAELTIPAGALCVICYRLGFFRIPWTTQTPLARTAYSNAGLFLCGDACCRAAGVVVASADYCYRLLDEWSLRLLPAPLRSSALLRRVDFVALNACRFCFVVCGGGRCGEPAGAPARAAMV